MLAPLAIVFYMSFGIAKMSAAKAQTTFWVFAALMGASLSSIFLIFWNNVLGLVSFQIFGFSLSILNLSKSFLRFVKSNPPP